MELTVDETLKKGVDAHKAGQIQEAERLYTAILEVQPKHPDANHNMGVLAVGVGKVLESLPFFKTALETNSSIDQFWLSYITALIKLGRLGDANDLFDQAKGKGANGVAFDQLEQQLAESTPSLQDPPTDQLQSLINLYTQGQLQQALSRATKMMESFPSSVVLYNVAGASNAGLMQFDAAIDNYKQALTIKPDYAETYNNMGNALNDKGDLKAAIDSYKQALKIKPDYAEAYNNMGLALNDKGDLEAAIDSFKKALKIKPDYAETYNNMGIALKNKGDLDAAIASYKNAININPEYAESYNNMGNALKDKGDLEAAIDSYNEAMNIQPDYSETKSNLFALLTNYAPKKEHPNLIVTVNDVIRKMDIKDNTPNIIPDCQIINLLSKSLNHISSYGLELSTELSQAYRRNSVDLNCKRHISIFNKHGIIPEFCFGCYKVQVEPRSIMELIKLYFVFDQLELDENNSRKCLIELRPEISGFYKGLIYCSGLKQANQIAEHLDKVIKQSIGSGLPSRVKRGCSEYPIAFPNYKEINNSGPQLMNYNEDWRVIETDHDSKKLMPAKENIIPSLSGFNLNDVLIIRKWIDYARGIGDPSADLINQPAVYYQDIYDIAKARLDIYNFSH